ncbi:MAG: hypothetical protein IPN29_14040 [Saprospiraceae bacterium]|nr:hypothetical protein [Saprospiraceae bacterium]
MKIYSWMLLLVFMTACKGDSFRVTPADLTGKWKFDKAWRNGKETKMLSSGYFIFHADNSVTSNIFQVEENKQFSVKDNTLSVIGQEALTLDIVSFTTDTMELEGKMGVFDMQFYLIRDKDTAPAR